MHGMYKMLHGVCKQYTASNKGRIKGEGLNTFTLQYKTHLRI